MIITILATITAEETWNKQQAFATANPAKRFVSVDDFNNRLAALCDLLDHQVRKDATPGVGQYIVYDASLEYNEIKANYTILILNAEDAALIGPAIFRQLNDLIQLAIATLVGDPYGDQQRDLISSIIGLYQGAGGGEVSEQTMYSLWTMGLSGLEELYDTLFEGCETPQVAVTKFANATS